jgi:hypothetical protein
MVHNITESRSFYGQLEYSLNPNITWLEQASAIGWDKVDADPWIFYGHPAPKLKGSVN